MSEEPSIEDLKNQIKQEYSSQNYKKVIECNPENIDAYFYVGLALFMKGLHFSAISYLEKAVNLQPDNSRAWMLLGDCYEMQSKLDDAKDCWKKAVEITPDNSVGIEAQRKLQS